jgi:hypothetical protein
MPIMSKVLQGQSFINKVLEQTGSVENAMDMALLNNVSITDNVTIGMEFIPTPTTDQTVVNYFLEKKPANGITISEEIMPLSGIGFMNIESTFKVS